jgi:Na+/melibiose symporter-like transporter
MFGWIMLAAVGGLVFLVVVTLITTTHASRPWWALVAVPVAIWIVSALIARKVTREPYEDPAAAADSAGGPRR